MLVDKEQIENLLFSGITQDENLLALLGDKFNSLIFTEKALQEVSNFYYQFYKKYSRLPNESEIQIFYSYARYKDYYDQVKVVLSLVNYQNIDKEILYVEFEKFIKERCALLVLNDIANNLNSNNRKPIEPANLVKQFESVANISLCDLHVFDVQKDVSEYFVDISNSSKRLSTGFKEIDRNINGGILADGKFLGVVFAETNMGKSIMLTNLATNVVRQGKNVLIISLELSETLYATRAYADLYSMPIAEISFMREELERTVKAHPEYGKLYIKEFPPGTVSVEQISGFIENLLRRGYHFDLVCVDYLALLYVPKSDNTNEAGKEITRKLRALTYKFNFPIMTAAQLNRSGFDNVPSNKHAAESIAIPQECDFAIGLYQQPDDRDKDIMRVKCTKSRLGSNDWMVTLKYNRYNLRFEDFTGVEDGDSITYDNSNITDFIDAIE